MKTVDSCVASGEGSGVSRGEVGAIEVAMTIGTTMGVPIGGVVVQRIGFRLSQAKRGYGENYDLNTERCQTLSFFVCLIFFILPCTSFLLDCCF